MNNAKYLRYAFCATLMLGIAPQTLSMDDLTRESDEKMKESRILYRKNQRSIRKNQGLTDRNQELETESESLKKTIDRNDKTTRSLKKACSRDMAACYVMCGSLLVWLGWELYTLSNKRLKSRNATPRTNQRNKSSY